MEILKNVWLVLLLAAITACGTSTGKNAVEVAVGQESVSDKIDTESSENIDLINTVYDKFVFAIDSDGGLSPETYFTTNALKKLQADYEFDCEEIPCYAYYALRTGMQDSNPESDGVSQIYKIDSDENGWYIVTYSDVGWPGKTRIKIRDGKIDDYQRLNQ